jgi:outer membrane protein OmpA-like peptidoglycan-associated protein
MHVDLGDFRFLSAQRGQGEGAEHLALLVSRSRLAGFAQRIRVSPGAAPKPTRLPQDQPPGPLAVQLQGGSVVLQDLDFQTGAGGLGPGPHPALVVLADYLRANPDHRIALVGHTDASGSFEGNRALSLRRAEEVRDRLIRDHGIAPDRIEAHGVGYLVPRASNLTEEGRALNRRVEAALISTR